jgi:hypothetical protein
LQGEGTADTLKSFRVEDPKPAAPKDKVYITQLDNAPSVLISKEAILIQSKIFKKVFIAEKYYILAVLWICIIRIRMRLFLSYETGSGSFHVAKRHTSVPMAAFLYYTLQLAGKILKSSHIRLYNVIKNLQVRSGSGKIKWIHTDPDLQHCKLPLHSFLYVYVTFWKGNTGRSREVIKKMSSILADQ